MKSWKSVSTRRSLFASAFVFVCVAALSSMDMTRVTANFSHYSNYSSLRSAEGSLGLFQGGIGSRTIISTIVGGGFSANAPVKSAPMVQPTAVAIDPQGRGFYVVDESNSASYLRFVNTTANPVTLGGVTIQANSINLIAGGGLAAESAAAREVDLTLVTGIAVDPTGNAVYLTTPFVGALRAINVGTQNFTILNKTIAPGAIQTIYNLNLPDFRSIVVNSARDFYYIGTGPNGSSRVIYKLESAANNNNGLVSVFAGGGTPQNGNGDDGQATLAKLTNPMALALDASGLLYVAEGGDTRTNPGAVRKIEPNGLIVSVIKNLEFPTGIAIAQGNNLYVALGNAQQVIRVSPGGSRTLVAGSNQFAACDLLTNPNCGDGGPATAASLNLPGSTVFRNLTLAADANGFYLPDFTFKRVRYVNLAGGTTTVAGTVIGPGQINTVAGSGQDAPYDNIPATITELQAPVGAAVDANGNLFVSDSGASPLNLLRFVNRGNSPVTFFAGTDWEMTAQPGQIITLNNRAGDPTSDDRIATAVFQAPQGLVVTANGVYIVDSQYGALVRPPNSLNGRRSGHIRFLNTTSGDVTIFPSGGVARVVVPAGQIKDIVGRNDPPPAGTIGEDGPASAGVVFPSDVAVDAAGNIYIADQGNNRIRRVNGLTGIITSVQSRQSDNTLAPLVTNAAAGVSFGPDGRLYIADTRNDRVLRQDAVNGTTFTVIANAAKGINKPRDLTINSAGQVFVTNSGNHQVLRIVAPANDLGSVSVVAGTGSQGFSGDGGPGNQAKLNFLNPANTPNDIQVTANIITLSNGDMVFSDTNNDRIRLLAQIPNQTPVLAAVSDRTVDEGTTTTISFTATDGNNDPLTLAVSNKPAFANFTDNGNGTASLLLTPGFSDAGSYVITVTANDGDATDSKSFTLTVKDVNRAPAVEAAAIGSPLEAASAAGRQVNLSGTATDPDGDTMSYKWFDGATQIANTANATVTLSLGNHSIFLTATDSKNASGSSPAQTVVVQDTTPPVISGVPSAVTAPATSAVGAVVNYALPTATDVVSGNTLVTADKASGSVFAVGTTNVKFTATDGRGNTATASFNVTVTPFSGGGGGGSYTISTYAGTGAYGFSGDNGPAGNASFKQLTALSHDQENNLLVVDAQSRNVRRIETNGTIRQLAGNSGNGNGGDAGLAIYATFGSPGGAAGDAAGNVYISDVTNHRIRRVGTDGKIFHFAGSTTGQSGGIGDNGQASTARFNRPSALVVDAQGNLYIADTGNNRVRVVSAATGIVTTVAGNGGAGYSGDGGPATSGSLNNPSGLAFDAQGNLYIADRSNHRVRKVNLTTKVITTAAGEGSAGFGGDNGLATTAQLNNPNDVAFDSSGNLLIADQSNNRIRRVNTAGQITTVAGDGTGNFGGDGGAATLAQLNLPSSLLILADGTVFVGDNGNSRIRKLAPVGGPGNRNPVIASTISNQTLTKGQSVDLPLAATDADNDSVTFTLVNGPSFATIVNANPAARTATLRLAPAQAGTFNNIQVKADDGKGGTTTSSAFNITVIDPPPSNRAPVITSTISNQTLTKGLTVDLPLAATDADNDSVSFTLVNGPSFATIVNANPAGRTATLRLAPAVAGTFSNIQVKADDGKDGTATSPAFVVVVNEPQNNPCLANVAAERWKGEYFNNRNLTGSPTLIRDDGDGSLNFEFGTGSPNAGCGVGVDNFSTRWTRDVPLLAGLYRFTTFTDDGVRLFINGQNRIDRWIDQGETRNDAEVSLSAGKHAVRMEYYENGGGATARLFWNALNYFPIIPNIANQTVTRGQVLEVDIIATEPDNDPVILSLSNAPSFVTLIKADPTNRRATLRIAPQGSEPEQQVSLTVLAGDGRGGGGVSNTFTITVKAATPQNRAPAAVAKPLPASVTAPDNNGATAQLDGSGSSDPDGDALSYSWTDHGAVIATTAVANVKLAIGAHSIVLTVNDGKGGVNSTSAQSVAVNAPAPTGVVINSISPASGRRGTTVNVVITGSGFVQGSFASFSGGGVSTTTTFINENQLNVRASILSTSLTTARNLTITDPNGASAMKTSAFTVTQ